MPVFLLHIARFINLQTAVICGIHFYVILSIVLSITISKALSITIFGTLPIRGISFFNYKRPSQIRGKQIIINTQEDITYKTKFSMKEMLYELFPLFPKFSTIIRDVIMNTVKEPNSYIRDKIYTTKNIRYRAYDEYIYVSPDSTNEKTKLIES